MAGILAYLTFQRTIVVLVWLIFLCPFLSRSQWSTDPSNNLIIGYGLLPEIASDSAGGCFITYEQGTTYPRHLILERLNRYGYKPWGTGKQITGVFPERSGAKIVSDGNNGVIISYLDVVLTGDPHNLQATSRLRVQRVDSSGNFLWGADGVRVTDSETEQSNQAIVSDAFGGCVVDWADTLSTLRMQRIESLGQKVWGDSGLLIGNSSYRGPTYGDGAGGCYVSFEYGYIQRFREDGNSYWPNPGIRIPTGVVTMGRDASQNLYLFGGKFIGYNGSVNVWTANLQKMNSAGSLLWDSSGVFVDTIYNGGGLTRNRIVTTSAGISFLAWDNVVNMKRKAFGLIVSPAGISLSTSPFTLSSLSSDEWTPQNVISDSQSAVYIWRDYDQSPSRIYVQRFGMDGKKMWDTMNIAACVPALEYEQITTDCSGGCIILGARDDFSVRAQQVSRNGNLGELITSIDLAAQENPAEVYLYQNYPNPFNPTTIIRYNIAKTSHIQLVVFDLLGQKLKTLVDRSEVQGLHSIQFEGGDLPPGAYFYRLETEEAIVARKFILVK
jgi:hypothetical protein